MEQTFGFDSVCSPISLTIGLHNNRYEDFHSLDFVGSAQSNDGRGVRAGGISSSLSFAQPHSPPSFLRGIFTLIVLLTLTLIIFSSKSYAVPACPSPFELKQPSGKTFEARKSGDEWYTWVETKDGYGIYKNTETGYWEYYVPSDETPKKEQKFRIGRKQDAKKRAIVSEADPATLGIPKGLRPPRKEDGRPKKPDQKQKISPRITPHPSPLPQGERESRLPQEERKHTERVGEAEDSPLKRGDGGVFERIHKQPPESRFVNGDFGEFHAKKSATSTAVSGTMHMLVIGVDYDDCPATYSASQVQQLVFGSSNSVADYYNDVSYSAVTIKPATESQGTSNDGFIGWLRLSGKHPYYSSLDKILEMSYLLKDALIAADPYIDYSSYDTDKNGSLDPTEFSILVIVAGYEESSDSSYVPSVWAKYTSCVFSTYVDNVSIGDFAVVGEKHGNHLATIGVMCHEVGHLMFSLPELYGEGGLGYFDLMAQGNWGAKYGAYGGSSPTQLSAWTKEYLGWGTITTVSSSQTISFPKSDGNKSSIFRMNTSDSDQYFLIENREFSGYDIGFQNYTGISGHGGLVIYHVDNSVQGDAYYNWDANNRRVDVEEANGRDTAFYMAETNMFFFSGNNSSFTDITTPDSKLKNGDSTYISITNISPYGNTMTSSALRPPIAVTGSVTNLTSNSATLNGTINSYGQTVTVWCEYGTESKLYKNETSTQAVSDSSDTEVSFDVDELSDKTTYYYRIVAQTGSVKIYGKEANFTHVKTTPKLNSSISSDYNSLALKSDGSVWAWGYNGWYGLGDGTTEDKTMPVKVLYGATDIAAGGSRNFALKPDNTVWGWGSSSNIYGSYYAFLGLEYDIAATPVRIRNLSESRAIACGEYHTVLLKQDGTVYAWGSTDSAFESTPVQVNNLTGVMAIAGGRYHSLALKSDGTVWAWGYYNVYGQLGDGTTKDRNTPVQVSNLDNVVAIASGDSHSLALKTDGTVWAWGYNKYGQLGDGTTEYKNTAVQVTNLDNVVAIGSGASHSLALKSDGTVWAWGANWYGQLGDSTTENRNTPVQVKNINLGETSADAIAPTCSISINNGDSYTDSTAVTLTLAATDAFGVTGYYVSTSSTYPSDSDTNWTPVSSTTFYSENISYTLSDGDGTKKIYVWYKDAAGNISNKASDSIILDAIAPTITISSPTSNLTYTTSRGTISLSGSASDSGSGVSSVTWSNNKGGSGIAIGTDQWFIPDIILSIGENVITITAIDGAGYTVTDTITITYGLCEAKSMEVSQNRVVLRRGRNREVTVSVKGISGCPVEGIETEATVNDGGKLISVSPVTQQTDENGETSFTITANKIGRAKVTFKAGTLEKTLVVGVKK